MTLFRTIFMMSLMMAMAAVGFAAPDVAASVVGIGGSAIYLTAGIGVGVAAAGSGIGIGMIVSGFLVAMSRNPGLQGKLAVYMFLGVALVESAVIYALVMSFYLLYAAPVLTF